MGPRALAGLVAGGILGGAGLAAMCVNAGSSWAKSEVPPPISPLSPFRVLSGQERTGVEAGPTFWE